MYLQNSAYLTTVTHLTIDLCIKDLKGTVYVEK